MAYSDIRFIAYHMPTIAAKKSGSVEYELPAEGLLDDKAIVELFSTFPDMDAAAGFVDTEAAANQGKPDTLVRLKGEPDSLKLIKADEDLFARLQRLLVVLEFAATTLKYRKDLKKDGVLNLFVAPEFYFRPPREPRAYSGAVYAAISDVLAQTIGSSPALKHWLVIPGTIVWYRETFAFNGDKWRVDQNTALVINGAVGYMGGKLIEKMRPSRIDGVPSQRLPNEKKLEGINFDGDWINRAEYYQRTDMWTSIKDHIIEFGGLRIGTEICADHSVLKMFPDQTGDIIVQLLISCGMAMRPKNIVVKPGGYAMRCDGHYGSGVRWDLRKVVEYSSPSEDTSADRWDDSASAILSPDNKMMALTLKNKSPYVECDVPFNKEHPLYWKEPETSDPDYWTPYTQGVSFFDPMKV